MADSDLADLRKQCITSLYLCTDNVNKYLDSEKDAEFYKLRMCVQQYCTLEAQQEVANEALSKAKEGPLQGLEERFKSHLSNLADRRLRVDNHPYVLEFNKRSERGMPAATYNMDESDLAITETQEPNIDPITKAPISDPVKNSVCKHIYERKAIMCLIERNPRTKCPVAGCANRNPILPSQLISDEELKFRMRITQQSTMIQETSIMDLDFS